MSPGIANPLADPLAGTRRLPAWALGLSALAHLAALFGPALPHPAALRELPPLAVSLRLPAAPAAASAPSLSAPSLFRAVPPAPAAPRSAAVARAALPKPAPLAVAAGGAPSVSVPAFAPPSAPPSAAVSATASATSAAAAPSAPPAVAAAAMLAPAPAADPDDGAALARYVRLLGDLLAQQQQYPRLAAARGWEGEVRLRLRVARKGTIVAVHIVHSSGFDVLDQHAVQLVHNTPLPPPPAGQSNAGSPDFQIDIPIHYALKSHT